MANESAAVVARTFVPALGVSSEPAQHRATAASRVREPGVDRIACMSDGV